jgi:fumarate hydratase class I
MHFLHNSLVELITQTATNLPPDVRAAMSAAGLAEKPNTQASQALNIIFSNIDMAADDSGPICQDTGMPTFYVHTPVGVNQIAIRRGYQAGQAAAQFGRFDYRQKQRRQSGPGHAGDSLRTMGRG